jgi:hypothetical protein
MGGPLWASTLEAVLLEALLLAEPAKSGAQEG